MANDIKYSDDYSISYPYISKSFLLMFCGYVIIWYLQIGFRIPALGAIRFEFIYAAILTVIAVLFTPKINTDCPLLPYIILYFLVIVIQVPFSYDFDRSWDVFVDRIIKFAFMAFFIVAFVRSPIHLKYFLAAFLLACLKMGQEGFVGKITGSMIWENQGVMRLNGSTPLYAHPNSFSGMALGTVPFIYYLFPLCNKYLKALLVLLGLLSLNIIIFTASRTGYVGLMVFLALIVYRSKNKMKFLSILLLLLTITIFFIPSDYIGRFTSIFTMEEKEGHSSEKRMEIQKDAWQIFTQNPLGIGVSAFPKKRMDTFGRNQDTHNLYLEIATNLGIQGVIVFFLFIISMLKMFKQVATNARDKLTEITDGSHTNSSLILDLKLIEATALATSAFIYVRLTLGLFGMDLYEIYWWFALGISISLYTMMNTINNSANSLKPDYSSPAK